MSTVLKWLVTTLRNWLVIAGFLKPLTMRKRLTADMFETKALHLNGTALDSGTSGTLVLELELVPTKVLMAELASRYDAFVIIGTKYLAKDRYRRELMWNGDIDDMVESIDIARGIVIDDYENQDKSTSEEIDGES
jgi:hypothetical protein